MSREGEEERWGSRAVNRIFAEQMGNAFVVLRLVTGLSQAEVARRLVSEPVAAGNDSTLCAETP